MCARVRVRVCVCVGDEGDCTSVFLRSLRPLKLTKFLPISLIQLHMVYTTSRHVISEGHFDSLETSGGILRL